MRLILYAMLLACCWALPVAADSPAQLVVGERSIEELLRLPPSLDRGRYAIHCEAQILRSGRAPQAYCYTLAGPAPDDLVDAVTQAALRASFVPAMRDRKPVEVYAVFMVHVDTTLAKPMILAVPNNGVESNKYGLLYTAPQRLIKKPFWGMPGSRYFGRRPDRFVLMQFQVDEHGKVTDLSFRNLTNENAKTIRSIEKQVSEYEFMAGSYEGRPVAMLYVEPNFSIY